MSRTSRRISKAKSQRFSDIRMVEWKFNLAEEEWAGGWWGATCPTSTRGWINIQKSNFKFSQYLNIIWQVAALLNNTSLAVKSICLIVFCWWAFLWPQKCLSRPHQSNFPSYFLSYSEAAVLAFSVTPGYFNPPHFWIWTGNIWIHGQIQVLPSISTLDMDW